MKSRVIWKECMDIIDNAVKALEEKNTRKLRTLSNSLIHTSSIYQDPVTIKTSIILHAIYKLAEKGVKRKKRQWKKFVTRMSAALTTASEALFRNDLSDYLSTTNLIFKILEAADSEFNDYFTHVVEKARLNKGWKFHEHGLSLGMVAKLIGENKWELQDYLGSTKTSEMFPVDERPLKDRYSLAENLLLQNRNNGNHVFVLDSSTIISLVSTSLHSILKQFRDEHSVQFMTGNIVIHETVEQGLNTKTHRLNSLQILDLVETGIIDVIDTRNNQLKELMKIVNELYSVNDHPITIFHEGEAECLLVANMMHSNAILIDERTTRLLIEKPKSLRDLLRAKLHSPIKLNKEKLALFQRKYYKQSRPTLIRSAELAVFSFEHGMLKNYANRSYYPRSKREILEGILWALKSKGCTISTEEINIYLDMIPSPLDTGELTVPGKEAES
ncbi:MAG: hypothetical protein ACXAEU_03165 [Candidatus Hodarchaeales archaeon]|jgi:predicted nucleic acid-binding protein